MYFDYFTFSFKYMISVSLGGAQGNAINWQNGDIPSWTYFNGLLTMKVCPHTYKRASREYNSRLEAKNLRGIYKFSFTNVFILYYFFKKFQIVFSYSSLNIDIKCKSKYLLSFFAEFLIIPSYLKPNFKYSSPAAFPV